MRIITSVISLLLIHAFCSAQVLTGYQIDTLASKTLAAFNVPGIAIAVIKDGKIVHSKGYGVRSLNTKQPVDENTLFGIASNTKAFTASALGMLVDEGKLQWDDKVVKYIPEFQLYDPWVTKEFTIRDLLTHRSGLGLGAGDLMRFPDSADFNTKDIIHNLRYLRPVSSFRNKYDYDNNLYIVAGEVLARISGSSWDDFIEQRFLQPLVMTRSAASFDRLKDKTNVIDGHAPVEEHVRVIARYNGKGGNAAGAIYSSIADLSRWVLLQLAHGKYGANLQKQLFSDEVHEETWSPQTIIKVRAPGPYNTHFAAYGLGFSLSDVKGYKQINHTGGRAGMVTQVTMLPELNLGIIVLTNQQEGGAYSAIANQIKDGYLNLPARDWVAIISKGREQVVLNAKKITDSIWNEIALVQKRSGNNINMAPYLGTYHDQWLGDATISLKNGKPWFDAKRSPKLTGEVLPYKENMFIVKWRDRSMDADAFIMFSKTGAGKVEGMTMKAISLLTDFSYDFHDLDFKKLQ